MIRFKIDIIKALKEKGVSYYTCREGKGEFAQGTLRRLQNNETITTETINRLCRILECDIADLLEYVPDNSETDA